jgi:hypothetical protein
LVSLLLSPAAHSADRVWYPGGAQAERFHPMHPLSVDTLLVGAWDNNRYVGGANARLAGPAFANEHVRVAGAHQAGAASLSRGNPVPLIKLAHPCGQHTAEQCGLAATPDR